MLITPMWRRVVRGAGILWLVWVAVTGIVSGDGFVFVAVIGGLMALAWLGVEWRPGRASITTFGALSFVFVLVNAPFLVPTLAHPESVVAFDTTLLSLSIAIAGSIAGLAAWWRALGDAAARITLVALGSLLALGMIVGLVAALGLHSDTAREGDLVVVAHRSDYQPEALSAPAGTVAIFVENQDSFRHTFRIDALDLQVEIPATTDRRIEVDLPPGTYVFHCTIPGHEGMTGTITVGG
jgi:plastocyanin